jgi:hypothetical protein
MASVTSMCVYQVRAGTEREFERLLRRHWPTLHELELVTDNRAIAYRGRNDDGSPFFVEFLEWRDETMPDTAHSLPEVAAIWEAMGPLCEDRNGKPAMAFPSVESLS